ncbi:MAG: arginase [Bdellovibrionales bacterium]|nr:arginase [Bdellovibrionales bacterium]
MNRIYSIIGAAFGLAAGMPETEMGPQAMRDFGLINRLNLHGVTVKDRGNVQLKTSDLEIGDLKRKYFKQILEFGKYFSEEVNSAYEAGETPIILGGDHSTSIFSISTAVNFLKKTKGDDSRLGLLWVDAHADINCPESSPSGNVHGMSTAALLGIGDPELCNLYGINPKILPDDIVYVGLRDVDPPEKKRLKKLGLSAYSMTEVDRYGLGEILSRALKQVTSNTDKFILSMDLDVCDPKMAPGVGSPVRGGLTFRESHLVMEMVARREELLAIELMEFNPVVDIDQLTAEIAVSLLESAVGKSIL